MGVVTDAYDKEPSKTKDLAKRQVKKQIGKHGQKVVKHSIKLTAKTIKYIVNIISGLLGGILLPVICVMLITVLIVNFFGQVYNVEQYRQECPELVKYFLENNYEEFESKVNSYVHDPEFVSFVCNSEFDNGYTKLVYGGTSAYTQDELKGNYKGIQGQSANWVTYNKDKKKYSAKSVLNKIQEYIDQGVNADSIKIKDDYLKGYGEASGYGGKESLPFTQWINNSYYAIPYYYHFNMAKNSDYVYPSSCLGYVYEGTKGGLPNWFQDKVSGSWDFMSYATTDGSPKCNDGIAGYPNIYRQIWSKSSTGKMSAKEISYKDYLKTGWTSFKPTSSNAGNIPASSAYEEDYNSGNCYFAEGVMLGYKMYVVDTWFEKAINTLWNRDENYDYQPLSQYYTFKSNANGSSKFEAAVDDLYLYRWFNLKSGKKSNYEKYIMNVNNINTVSKREGLNSNSIVNTNIELWLNNFAEYFAKEIYYIYPNRQYIIDYFLNNNNSDEMKHKRIAFLQRSFYAMATGSELDVSLDEEYEITGGKVGNVLTENNIGSLDINKLEIDKVNFVEYSDDFTKDGRTKEKEVKSHISATAEHWKNYYIQKEEDIVGKTFEAEVVYKARIHLTYKNNKKDVFFNVPIKNKLTIDLDGNIISNKLIFNPKGYKNLTKSGDGKYLRSLATFIWDENYYESQYTYDNEGTIKNENPLDSIDMNKSLKLKNYKDQEWKVKFTELNPDNLKTALRNYCGTQEKTQTNPLFHLFDGTIKGSRVINIEYSDHSFLNYDVAEKKDANGKIEGVTIEIYTYYPDLSKYGDTEYRIAYGLENGDALQEAYNLLQYTQANKDKQIGGKNAGKKLIELNEKVDFSKLLISVDDGSYIGSGGLYSDEDVYTYIATILAEVESSNNWGAIARPYANTQSEATITVGAYQFYGENAHYFLKKLCKSNKKEALKYISEALYKEIVSDKNWETIGWKPSKDSDYTDISKLIKSDFGIDCQKETMAERAKAYVDSAIKENITDVKAQVYYAVMYHQSPKRTKEVINSLFTTTITLESLHKARAKNSILSDYVSRYNTTYEFCKKITVMKSIKGDLAGVLKYAQSNRVIGKPYSNARSDFLGTNGLPSSVRYKATYDCSEFVACCYYYGMGFDFGKNYTASNMEEYLEKNNYTMVCSRKVDTSKLVAGDVMFFNSQNGYNKGKHGISHVAIYFGDGKCVEAGNPVGIYNVATRSNFYKAYRIVENSKESKNNKKKK